VNIVRGEKRRHLHKGFLRPQQLAAAAGALKTMGRAVAIGNSQTPSDRRFSRARGWGGYQSARKRATSAVSKTTALASQVKGRIWRNIPVCHRSRTALRQPGVASVGKAGFKAQRKPVEQ
jgi:hypothetical protein